MASPPAFSMGKAHRVEPENRKNRDFAEVGPGSYAASLIDKKKEPSFSMGAKVQTENTKLNVPGPGVYEAPQKIVESPGKSMAEKLNVKQLQGTLGPGPGGYSVDKQKKQNFSYSMGSKLEDIEFKKRNFQPGPGNYQPEKRHDIPSMKFGSGSRADLNNHKEGKQKPGPGQYTANNFYIQRQSPKFGFGSSVREHESPSKLKVPGPGNYAAKNHVGEGQKYSMAATIQYEPHKKEQAFKPGAGTYSPEKNVGKKKEPAYKIGTEQRQDLAFKKQTGYQTAPGQYDPNLSATKLQAAGWKIGTDKRPGQVHRDQKTFPASNAYTIPSRAVEGPQVHMHAKTDKVDQNLKKNVPGPGKYDLQNSPNNRHKYSPAYSLGTSTRVDIGTEKQKYKPGPGVYDQEKNFRKSAPSYGFGTQKRPEVAKSGRNNVSPGPGTYVAKKYMGGEGTKSSMSPKFSVDQFKEKKDKLVPGPGQYEFHLRAMKTAPNYGFGSQQRAAPGNQGTKGLTTEPAGYNPEASFTKNRSPNYRIGTQKRQMFDDKKMLAVPAPGSYELKSINFNPQGNFHMGIKLKEQSKMVVPGAGSYEPNSNKIKKAGPNYSMGMKLKSDLIRSVEVPGPGQYSNATEKFKQSAPQFGFGSSKRPDITGNKKFQTPGPGNYKVPSKVGDVAPYAFNRDDKAKYV